MTAGGLRTAARAVADPFILLLVGTVVLASLLPPRGPAVPLFANLADGGIVLLFFLHGAKLSREAIWAGARNWRLHLAVVGMTFLLFPLLGLALAQLPLLDPTLAAGMLFLCLLPSTVQSSIAFTSIAGGNVVAALCSASLSQLIGIFATPALVALTMNAHAGMSFDALEKILLLLLAPFLAGHFARPLIGGFVARHKGLVGLVDRGSILLVVYVAFGAAVVGGLWSLVSLIDLVTVVALSCALLAVIFSASWGLGGLLGFAREDRIVLLFCGSKKSLVAGVPMAGILFAPTQIGMILLPIMLFHQIQLIACAILARRFATIAGRENIA
ncbi:bile acid:sodium symporter family protein [Sphingomonas sp. 1P06PA]|uniref:bile acid:sodium symporter family protein n=1 Tax=Sphingomonas sp. 1P06PA TaxID=554121 RepID=UPI0039A4F6BD